MDTAKMVHVLGQVQHLLALIDREAAGVKFQLARDAHVEGIELGSLAAQVVRCKHRIQEVPAEAYAPAYFASSSHLPALAPAALARAAQELGITAQHTAWGLFLDYSGFGVRADQPASELKIALVRLGRWAAEIGARWIVLAPDGPVIDGLSPLAPPQRVRH